MMLAILILIALELQVIPAVKNRQCTKDKLSSPDKDCIDLFFLLQEMILNDNATKYVLTQVFYSGSEIEPNLLNITYNISFTNNSEIYQNACKAENTNLNVSETMQLFFGWSERSVYAFFHPAVVNQLRYQLPFWIMSFTNGLLSDEPDVDAYLWDGLGSITLLTLCLNITLQPTKCLTYELLYSALYEITENLQTYADYGLDSQLKANSPTLKLDVSHGGQVLTQTMVMGSFSEDELTTDGLYGMNILETGYSLMFAVIVLAFPLLMIGLSLWFHDILEENSQSNHCTKQMCVLASFTLIAFAINILVIWAEFDDLSFTDEHTDTKYSSLKTGFLVCIMLLCFFGGILCSISFLCNSDYQKHVVRYVFLGFAICTTSFFSNSVFLGFLPLVLLIFSYPIDTCALVTLHYATIYSFTVIVAVMIHYDAKTWKYTKEHCECEKGRCCKCNDCLKMVVLLYLISLGAIVFVAICFIYIYAMLMFQLLISRYNLTGENGKTIASFLPSAAIVISTYILNRQIFAQEKTAEKKSTDEKKKQAAGKNNEMTHLLEEKP